MMTLVSPMITRGYLRIGIKIKKSNFMSCFFVLTELNNIQGAYDLKVFSSKIVEPENVQLELERTL